MLNKRKSILVFTVLIIMIAITLIGLYFGRQKSTSEGFNGSRAYQDVIYQVDLGPRIPGTQPHAEMAVYIKSQLEPYGWKISVQESVFQDRPIRNIVAQRGSGSVNILLGAHYDTRMIADNDPIVKNRSLPVPGANDGASGVAVLLELGRSLPRAAETTITLLFIDSEDQGKIPGWDWILGSTEYASQLKTYPDAVVIVDMIGDSDLNIYRERNSDPILTDTIWDIAAQLGYSEQFINQYKYQMLDDHMPFVRLGIPAIDIIDFDYPYWHTTADTPDKVSAASLEKVGKTLYVWITSYE